MNTTTAEIHQDLFVDSGIDGRGHRVNLMNGDFREVGAGIVTGNFNGYNAVMVTEDFGTTVEELMSWPALQDKGFWQPLDHPDAGVQTYPGPPFTLDGGGFRLTRAPRLGEHTQTVLCSRLGLNADDLDELRAKGVV